ncbi:hypothetical protein EDC03_2420 [Pseudokineococcus lusitanus]|uniref:Uncharacterized protein n=1 Tax=Pseudokineococcus lusitanus TaxID=763993 RepID=A0A3N1GWK3_9ACTN|nr:hypothetical protein EDC03_2420 [Pseudokineococcus lusitanus]
MRMPVDLADRLQAEADRRDQSLTATAETLIRAGLSHQDRTAR